MREYLGIKINTARSKNLTEQASKLLQEFYLRKSDGTPQQAFARAAVAFSGRRPKLAQELYDAVSKGWFMYSSPVLSNAPEGSEKPSGLPISCFLTYVGDSLESLIEHMQEVAWLSVKGGGVGGHWSDVRAVSDKAPGPIPFLKVIDSEMTAYKQGTTRKGSYAAYTDIDNPDIMEFLSLRLSTGGDADRKCPNIHNAVNITDKFMKSVENNNSWSLIDPHTKKTIEKVSARELWERILETRFRTGEPYLNFIDTANRALPESLKALGLELKGSNLCNEIHLPTNEERTAVCCLSSLNLEKYDEWKDTNLVANLIEFLDNVLEFFIKEAPPQLSKAINSATLERSLGLGAMGWHSYLQKNNIPFESASAISATHRIFKDIKAQAVSATEALAVKRGEYPDGKGTGRRNSHLLAIAPNANSSIICGCSPSIEPWKSNAFTHRTRVGAHLVKNTYLEPVLQEYRIELGKEQEWVDEQWQSILENEGSVQHLSFLSDWHKDVFKTAFELDQRFIIEQAGARQQYLCQGQSLNVFFPPESPKEYVSAVHFLAWKKGCKGLYYLRTSSGAQPEAISTKVARISLADSMEECVACQG